MLNYESHQSRWEKFASIRSIPRRIVDTNDLGQDFFPRERLPICMHPLLRQRGEQCIRDMLVYHANHFMNDIAILETEVVNNAALMISSNIFSFIDFPSELRHDALTVIVDEAYHAYVAIDFLNQINAMHEVTLANLPDATSVTNAILNVKKNLPQEMHKAFELVSVCISEHVLTKELIEVKNEVDIAPSFKGVMKDHVLDEGRHAKFFAYVLSMFWKAMPDHYRDEIGPCIPEFIKEYLSKDINKQYDTHVLSLLGFSAEEVSIIISDTYVDSCNNGMTQSNPVVVGLINLMQRCVMTDHQPTRDAFNAYQLEI